MPAKNGMKKNILDKLGDLINMCCVWDKEWLELVVHTSHYAKSEAWKAHKSFWYQKFCI